ncbi:cytochrome c oxidase subunit 1 [Campylobacter upsaliensis RM3195]|nr:cytochrome c oxidase subunit 1 [Campylobacter upsaliensis RM3195]
MCFFILWLCFYTSLEQGFCLIIFYWNFLPLNFTLQILFCLFGLFALIFYLVCLEFILEFWRFFAFCLILSLSFSFKKKQILSP